MPGIRTCQWPKGTVPPVDDDPCDSMCEGNSDYCGTHNKENRKRNAPQKEKKFYSIPRAVSPRQAKKEKGGWKKKPNTFLCSDGTRVTQDEIDRKRSEAYRKKYPTQTQHCHGCWKREAHGSGHIIAQQECKRIGKADLCWHLDNIFPACLFCNLAIENPKGENWKKLNDIRLMLDFIFEHDQELFQKFRVNGENSPELAGYFSSKKL